MKKTTDGFKQCVACYPERQNKFGVAISFNFGDISGFMVGGGAFRLPLPNGARVNKYIVNAMRVSFLFQHFGSK